MLLCSLFAQYSRYSHYEQYNFDDRLLFADFHTWAGRINDNRWAIITTENALAMGKGIFNALLATFRAFE